MHLNYENAPEPAATGIEGNANRTNSHEGTAMTQLTATRTLSEQIGEDWADLTEFERDCLHQLDGAGICLELLQYLATASTGNRRVEAAR